MIGLMTSHFVLAMIMSDLTQYDCFMPWTSPGLEIILL